MKNLLSANRFGTSVASAAFAVTGMLVGSATFSSAQAATLGCPANIADNVTNTSACEYSDSANQDFLNTNPMTVNQEQFFGMDDWEFIKRLELPDGAGQSGEWKLEGTDWDKYQTIMLTFKSGNATTLVSYLVTPENILGGWDSPFENPPFNVNNTKDVSHISYYGTTGTPVPEPLTMMGSAVALGFGGMFQKKRNAKKSGK